MTTIVFSDVHLSASPRGAPHVEEFTAFLRSLQGAGRVVCLGDLFDFWFEYRSVIFSAYFEVLRAFADMRDRGVELHFVRGNHDFWAGRFLHEVLGFSIHDELLLEQDGARALFVHGDGIDPRDWSYRAYKRAARARPVVSLFRLLHPDWAMALARALSAGSRNARTPADPSQGGQVEPLRQYARRRLEAGDAEAVLCGHSHYAVREEMDTETGPGLYLNTGDWLRSRSYVQWKDGDFDLRRHEPAGGSRAE